MKWIGQHIWDLTSRFRGISIFEKAIKLLKSDGGDGGVISMTGNDMVLSNAAGDVLIGSTTYQVGGDQDIFIGDGINSVDLVFEQSGAIKGYDSSVNLTIGGGGGTITFADKVNFVGGGIENEFQFNNLTIDGNFELSPITTTTSGGVLNGGFLNPAAEAKQVHMPQVLNDLAGFNHWGTVTVTGLYKTRTGSPGSYAYSNPVLPSDFANAFDGTSSTAGSWYSDNGASGTVQGEGVITLEWTNEALYGLWFGLVFGSDSFVPSRIKMEAYQTDVGWRTFADLTGVSSADIGNIILRQIDGNSGTGQATSKLRFTLGSSISGSYLYFRIHTIYLANYAQGNNNLSGLGTDQTRGYHYLERYRPNYAWGNFNPGQTTTYNLGSSSYRWATGYFNALDVAQSLNITGAISATNSVGNLNTSAGIGQHLEYGSTVVTTLRFDSDRWRLYAGGTSSEVATITEGGNLGIGTSSPSQKLHVDSGTENVVALFKSSDDTAQIQITDDDTTSYFGSKNGLTFISQTGSTASNGICLNGTDVGIGTISPGYKLDVVGDGIRSTRSTAGWAGWFENTGSSSGVVVTAGVDSGDAPLLIRKQDATELFSVRGNGTSWFNNGNVGIGITIPVANLHVYENSVDTNSSAGLTIEQAGTGDALAQFLLTGQRRWVIGADNSDVDKFKIASSIDLASDAHLTIDTSGNVGIGTTSPTEKLHVEGRLRLGTTPVIASHDTITIDIDQNNNQADNYFRVTKDGEATELFRVQEDGNVGIGTTSPSEKLHVNGNGLFSGGLTVGDSAADTFITRGHTYLATAGNNVGIGTTTASDTLTINAPTSSGISINNAAGSLVARLYHGGVVGNEFGRFYLKSLTTSSEVYLAASGSSYINSGNVGIGTSSPSYKLDIDGQTRIQSTNYEMLYLHQADANGGFIKFTNTDDADGWYAGISGSEEFIISRTADNSAPIITAEQNGYVGIGTSSPGVKLEVNGNVQATSYKISGATILSGSVNVSLGSSGGTGTISLNTHTSTALYVAGDDNVGIGTTSPSEKLEVNGKIKATDINFSGLPTSSAGLSSGDVWNDSGTLKIVS